MNNTPAQWLAPRGLSTVNTIPDWLIERKRKRTPYTMALTLVRTVLGFSVLGIGIIMIVTPGPAVVMIPLGLAILATEYAWARRYLKRFKEGGEKLGAILFTRRKKNNNQSTTEK